MRHRSFVSILFVISSVLGTASVQTAAAQSGRPAALEGSGGWATFVDESVINHGVIGGAARFYFTRRLSLGPEVTYMIGPGSDRDLFVTGNLFFDFIVSTHARPRVTPYLVVGGGFFQHSNRFGGETFRSHEGAFTAGAGVRIPITPRIYVAPEFRLGWEPHVRAGITIGFRPGR